MAARYVAFWYVFVMEEQGMVFREVEIKQLKDKIIIW